MLSFPLPSLNFGAEFFSTTNINAPVLSEGRESELSIASLE